MTENNEQKGSTQGCCGDDTRKNCCEQMMQTMTDRCKDGEMGFDCAAMMQKMGCTPSKPDENKQ